MLIIAIKRTSTTIVTYIKNMMDSDIPNIIKKSGRSRSKTTANYRQSNVPGSVPSLKGVNKGMKIVPVEGEQGEHFMRALEGI